MLVVGIGVAVLAPFLELFWYTIDWWQPATITNTKVGIEDLLLGFTNGGIAAVLYETVFRKRLYQREFKNPLKKIQLIIPPILGISIASICFWVFQIHSFYSNLIALFISLFLILLWRKDLIINSLMSGILLVIVCLPFYLIGILWLAPGYVQRSWLFENLTGILFWGIPIEDLIWYFIVGLVLGPFYEFSQQLRLRKIKK